MTGLRKLSTILFADIAGYSGMMQSDEVKALSVLDSFKTILEEEILQHGGSIIQYYGDGCLLSFDSAILGLQVSMALQRRFIDEAVPVRIGMHLGDVLFKNNNVFGNGVNVASRVESMGVPGAILISKTIRDQVKSHVEFELTSLGAFHFKNIPELLEVYAVANAGFVIPAANQMQGKLEPSASPEPRSEDRPEWERYQMLEILDALEENKCVLILGNYAFSKPDPTEANSDAELFLPELLKREEHKWLGKQPKDGGFDFFTSAQTLVHQPGGQRMFRDITRIKFQDLDAKQINRFKQISEIPFDLILSTYPFDLVHDVFEANQINHQYAYYSYMQETPALEPFSNAKPLLYNLFGSVKHKESMVISLDRLYQFIFGILGVRQLPKLIQDKVQQASHLVFLGFSFDEWYLKLLLRVLKVHEKEISYAHPAASARINRGTQRFFESNFKVTFLNKKIDEFIEGLHEACLDENMVRKGSYTTAESQYEKLQRMVEEYRLLEVLEQLDDLLIRDGKQGSLLRELGGYQENYHKMKEWEDYNRLSKQELEKKWRQLRNQISVFIDRVSESINL